MTPYIRSLHRATMDEVAALCLEMPLHNRASLTRRRVPA